MNNLLRAKLARADYLERRGLTGKRRYHRSLERAERVVLGFCAAMLIGAAAMGWLSGAPA